MKLIGIDHPAVAVKDVDLIADWCCRTLGYSRKSGNPGSVWLLESPEGAFLEIMKEDESPRPERGTFTPGWSHLALRVENLDEAIAFLESRNVHWTGETGNAVGGGRLRNFTDPEGNMWQIVQRN